MEYLTSIFAQIIQQQQLNFNYTLTFETNQAENIMKKQDLIYTPKRYQQSGRYERARKFMRKPGQKSQRSSSKKSIDTSVKQMYIKSPTSMNRDKQQKQDFFATLASSLITQVNKNDKRQQNTIKYKGKLTERYSQYLDNQFEGMNLRQKYDNQHTDSKNYAKIRTLEAQIQLKNHQIVIVSGEVQRLKNTIQEQRDKRKRVQNQKKQLSKQLKQSIKSFDNAQVQVRKLTKQKQHLLKQIQFLERINYDQKTRTLQSYRQRYLQSQVQKLRKQLHRSRGEREDELQNQIKFMKQQKFTIQSHYKAMKVANQCLIKQINHSQQNIHQIILNSEEYKKLRDKYIRFLEEYKLLRNQYWSLKAEINRSDKVLDENDSELFSLTASQIQNDLSLLKSPSNPQLTSLLPNSQLNLIPTNSMPASLKTKSNSAKYQDHEPTYSFNAKFS